MSDLVRDGAAEQQGERDTGAFGHLADMFGEDRGDDSCVIRGRDGRGAEPERRLHRGIAFGVGVGICCNGVRRQGIGGNGARDDADDQIVRLPAAGARIVDSVTAAVAPSDVHAGVREDCCSRGDGARALASRSIG
jgi:hypothetical protein